MRLRAEAQRLHAHRERQTIAAILGFDLLTAAAAVVHESSTRHTIACCTVSIGVTSPSAVLRFGQQTAKALQAYHLVLCKQFAT